MEQPAFLSASGIIRAAASIGVSSIQIYDDGGIARIGRCYPGVRLELMDLMDGPAPGFTSLWRQLRNASGGGGSLEGIFMPEVRCWEVNGLRYRMRYTPQARIFDLTGRERVAREIDILIS